MRPSVPKPAPIRRRVVLLDPEAHARSQAHDLLRHLGLAATPCASARDAIAAAHDGDAVVLASAREPAGGAIGQIEAVAARLPDTPILVYADHGDARAFRRLHRLRVADVLPWPLQSWEVRAAIMAAGAPGADGGALGHVLSVIGAKGGVGKTTVATNVAVTIAATGERSVLLIDLDTRFGDCAVQLDVSPAFTIGDLAGLADDELTVEELERALTQHDSGLWVLPGPRHPREWRPIAAEQIAAMLTVARRRFDYIVIDTPGAFTDLLEAGINRSETVLIVSSFERTSLTDTAQMLRLLAAESIDMARVRVVLDAVHHADGLGVGEPARILGRPPHLVIPYDEKVVRATTAGRVVAQAYPGAAASRELRRLAASVAPELADRPGSGFRRAFRRRRAPASAVRRSA